MTTFEGLGETIGWLIMIVAVPVLIIWVLM